jgi:ribose/xylose/arabinose/galactoside ABC-type transport system permease subunit
LDGTLGWLFPSRSCSVLCQARSNGLISYGLIEIKADPHFANSFLGALILLAIVLDRVREVLGERKRKA